MGNHSLGGMLTFFFFVILKKFLIKKCFSLEFKLQICYKRTNKIIEHKQQQENTSFL